MELGREGGSWISRLLNHDDQIGPLAVLHERITAAQLEECLAEQRRRTPRPPLREILTERGLLTPEEIDDLRRRAEEGELADASAPAYVKTIGRYGLVRELGGGGAGVVWQAWDPKLKRWVALKQPRSEHPTARERFVREAQAAAKVRHPNLIEVFEIGEAEGKAYIVMEYVEAQMLDQVSLDPRRSAALVADVCDAVEALHAAGILHRDIKPQNILVDSRGVPRLCDFGLAKFEGNEPLTVEGTLMGTPLYMAPEQAARRGEALGSWTDVYGLGATLFHALTGRPPFAEETNLETLFKKLMNDSAPSPRDLRPATPRELDWIVRRTLARDPQARYASAAELAQDLRRFLRDEPVLARAPTLRRKALHWVRRNRWAAAALLVVALAVASGAGAVAYAFRNQVRQRAHAEAREKADEQWAKAAGYARRGSGEEARVGASAEEAIRKYDDAARADPDDPYPLLMRGRCLALLGRGAEAEAAWTEALRRRPTYGPALFERGKRSLAGCVAIRLPRRTRVRGGTVVFGPPDPEDESTRERRRQGEADLAAARRSKDADKPVLAYLEGVLHLGNGEYAKAIDALVAYTEEYPWDAEGIVFLGLAQHFAGRFEAAEGTLKRALDLGPTASRFKGVGDARFCLGRFRDAAAAYTQATRLEPGNAPAWCNRGLARQADGDLEGAVADFQKAIELRPDFARAHKGLGLALYERGDWTGARRSFERATALAELDAEAHYDLGSALLRSKEVESSLAEFQIALEIEPHYSDAHLGLGAALLMRGDPERAAESLEKAASLDAGNADAHYHLALARWTKGDRSGAVTALQSSLERGGEDWPRRKEAEDRLRDWKKAD